MHSGPSDQVLLLAVTERDMGAFHTLYERHAGWLAIRLARRCDDRDLVADAIQDTFVAVWQRPQGFRGEGDIAAWLWGIAIRWLVSQGGVVDRLPYQVRIPASISRLRRRARFFSDVGDTCFHGQRLGDAIAGQEKARSDHCGD
jgi:Sigma-70 region 2